MNTVFADTYYFLALLNNTDQGQQKAVDFTSHYIGRLVTTGWVMTELADALAYGHQSRAQFARTLRKLQVDPNIQVFPCENLLFSEGVALYNQRPDKEWSLTDCISFVVMTREGIMEALTGDRHFEQAGFVAVLK